MLGDLILDFLDQKKVIKNSSKEFLRLFEFFEIHKKSTPENFKKYIAEKNTYIISEILTTFYLIAYVSKVRNNKKLIFKSAFQKDEFFMQDIFLENKDIRKVFTTEYQIMINAFTIRGMDKKDAKLIIDGLHAILILDTEEENKKNPKETPLPDFASIAQSLNGDFRKIEDLEEDSTDKIDNFIKKLVKKHYWGKN
tara:strand:+ start:162 stop:749 length:588 start_codon:yes stop_codon:yes gene_type:complete